MIQEIALALLAVVLLAIANICWFSPRKMMNYYKNQLKNSKYNIKVVPYKLFYNRFLQPFVEGAKVGDTLKVYKQEYPSYDIVISNIMNQPLVQLCHVDFIKDFFAAQKHYVFPKIPLVCVPIARLTGETVGFLEGKDWKKRRSMLGVIFNFDFIKSQTVKMSEVIDDCLNQMQKKYEVSPKEYQSHIFQDLLLGIFSRIILTVFLGLKQKQMINDQQVGKYITSTLDMLIESQMNSPALVLGDRFFGMGLRACDKKINTRERLIHGWSLDQVRRRVKQIDEQIKNGKTNDKAMDLVKSMVMQVQGKQYLSQKILAEELVGFLVGGTDTTANYLNMIIANLGKYPEIQQKMRQQVEQYMKDDDYSFENLKNLKYIDAIQKQTTRTYGPANGMLVREATQDVEVNGLFIKKGTLVSMIPTGNHHSPQHYKNPLEFRPERWLNGECEDLHAYSLVGFSAGARACPGKSLAMLQTKIALVKIIKRYRIEIPNKDFKMSFKFVNCPEEFKTKFVARS